MEIISNTTEFYINAETAVAIGKFDGVHIGHRRLIEEILEKKSAGIKTCIFTFDPTPSVFFGHGEEKELTTKEEKRKQFEYMGIDILIEFPFNQKTASMEPRIFVTDILCNLMGAVFIAAGKDISFGANGAGNAALLDALSNECGYQTKFIDKIKLDDIVVSSTLLRDTVLKGDMELANELVGRPYSITGIVTRGNHIGHTLNMPTVNLIPNKQKLLPPNGVYFTEVNVDGKKYNGVTNIGYRPSIKENEKTIGVETYLYDFSEDIYDHEIEVFFLKFRRAEQKFASIILLQEQLSKDKEAGRKFFIECQ